MTGQSQLLTFIESPEIGLNQFVQDLEISAGMKLKLRINNNRSTMVSVRWEPDHTRVSLHRMFLQAPQNVMTALACYIRGDDKIIAPTIKSFIETNLRNLDYSHLINPESLATRGDVYDLEEIYNEINGQYFDGRLNLLITWFGRAAQRARSQVTLGLYHEPIKLMKIHRRLDTLLCPRFVIAYVVYHEMLHSVCPSFVEESGFHRVHSKEFKEQEALFRQMELAQAWIREHYQEGLDALN